MFKLVEKLSFWWPVKVIEPDPEKPGKTVEHEFEAQFEIIAADEARSSAKARRAIVAEIVPDMSDADFEDVQDRLERHDRLAMLRVLKGWRNIADHNGNELDFTPEIFAQVWSERRVQSAFVRAYEEAITMEKARIKN